MLLAIKFSLTINILELKKIEKLETRFFKFFWIMYPIEKQVDKFELIKKFKIYNKNVII